MTGLPPTPTYFYSHGYPYPFCFTPEQEGSPIERQTCERVDADIALKKGSLYGHETPVLAPLACQRAAVWVLMREPIERLLSRLYKPIPANASILRVGSP